MRPPTIIAGLLACLCGAASGQLKPTHVAIEVHPGLFPTLARGADYPLSVVDYDGGRARGVLPARSRIGLGEFGHLRRLRLRLDAPEDVDLRFVTIAGPIGMPIPGAALSLKLRGPAEAEWWQKLPLVQGDWGRISTFRKPITLRIESQSTLRVARPKGELPYVWADFEKIRGEDVQLNVRGCPPWLDRVIEDQAHITKHVDTHIRKNLGPMARVTLPPLAVPLSGKEVVYRDIRPTVRNGMLRVEFAVDSQ